IGQELRGHPAGGRCTGPLLYEVARGHLRDHQRRLRLLPAGEQAARERQDGDRGRGEELHLGPADRQLRRVHLLRRPGAPAGAAEGARRQGGRQGRLAHGRQVRDGEAGGQGRGGGGEVEQGVRQGRRKGAGEGGQGGVDGSAQVPRSPGRGGGRKGARGDGAGRGRHGGQRRRAATAGGDGPAARHLRGAAFRTRFGREDLGVDDQAGAQAPQSRLLRELLRLPLL